MVIQLMKVQIQRLVSIVQRDGLLKLVVLSVNLAKQVYTVIPKVQRVQIVMLDNIVKAK